MASGDDKSPLRILQRAVLESGIRQTRDTCGPYQSDRDFATCVFCEEESQFFDRDTWEQAVARIEHRPDCAYRVAMELPPLSVPVVPRHLRHIEFEASE